MIFRINKDKNNPYVIINKEFLNDKMLSWKAKGLLSYLLSLPDDWKINISDLKNRSKDGKDSVYSTIRDLVKAGYIEKQRVKNEKGQITGIDYDVYEVPNIQAKKPYTEKPYMEKPALLYNNNTNNNNTNNSEKPSKVVYNEPSKVVYNEPSITNNISTNNIIHDTPHGTLEGIKEKFNTTPDGFERLWKLYDKKVDKEKSIKAYKKAGKLPDDIDKKIIAYVNSTPDKQYRKHFATWFNNKGWNNEIIVRKEKREKTMEELYGRRS